MLTPLLSALVQLGQHDGAVSPSIYDTAACIRWFPSRNLQLSISWLLRQQCADGGWGDPLEPHHRIIPTLSAILALQTVDRQQYAQEIDVALSLLSDVDQQWTIQVPPDLSVAAEIILPHLVDEARAAQLDVPMVAYQALQDFGQRRKHTIKQQPIKAGTPALHSWEVWESESDAHLLDAAGSVGHSPSATAMWLYRTRHRPYDQHRDQAQRYLAGAAAATGLNIPGIVPTVWPILRFEQTFGLYGLATLNLLQIPEIQTIIVPIVDDLYQRLLTAKAMGMSDTFQVDGDTTAATLAVLRAAGRICPKAIELFQPFMSSGYTAYPGELHSSISVIGRILHQLALDGNDISAEIATLCKQQLPDGTWPRDKWNISWFYSAWHAILPIAQAQPSPMVDHALSKTLNALRRSQHTDGGWGPNISQLPDTAFAMLALLVLETTRFRAMARPLVASAHQWLVHHIDDPMPETWIGKQLYSPMNVDRALAQTALFASYVSVSGV